MSDDKNEFEDINEDKSLNGFIQKYLGAIIGGVVAILLCFTQLYKLVIILAVIAAGIILGNYIQKNKNDVKDKLKNLIDKF